MAYLLMFSIVIMLSFQYENSESSSNIMKKNLKFFIIIIPSIFAALRDVSVGTDNISYYRIFDYCLNNTLGKAIFNLSSSTATESIESGFVLLTWICAKIFPNYYFFNFITSLVTFIFIVKGAEYYSDRISFTWIIITYLFTFFCPMINYVRQAISLSIVFYSWKYAEQQKPLKFLLCIMFAAMIHLSAIIAIPIYILFKFRDSKKSGLIVFATAAAMIIIVIMGPNLVYQILVLFSKMGLRTEVLLKYSRRFVAGEYTYNMNFLLRFLPQLIVGSLLYKRLLKLDDRNKVYYSMMWIQMPIVIMGSMYDNFSRLALYYHYSVLVLFPGFIKCAKKTMVDKLIAGILLFTYIAAYWTAFTVYNHYNFLLPVYPYKIFF